MATEQENMDNLMKAAQAKLNLQKKQQEQSEQSVEEDIYADLKAEMDEEDNDSYSIPEVPTIQRQPNYDSNINIQYNPDDYYYEDEYELDPNDTPLFENGPGLSQIEIWKKQFTREKIFHTQILEKHFIFRTLNRFEYKQIVALENIDALYREEVICSTCVLWPIDYNFKKMANEDSGYPSTLAQIIMENSGFTKEYGIEVL